MLVIISRVISRQDWRWWKLSKKETSSPTLSDAIKTFFDSRLAETLHTCTIGKITKYDSKKRKAIVQPLIKRKYLDNTILNFKPIENVPVLFYGAGNAIIRIPESQVINQTCLLLFCERSLDIWLSKGNEVEPGSQRKFDLSDAIAILAVNSFNNTDEGGDDFSLQYDNSLIRIKKNGMIEMGIDTFKKLVTEDFVDMFNNHVHNFTAAPSGAFSTSTPASLTGLLPPPVGGIPFPGVQMGNSQLTSIVKAE